MKFEKRKITLRRLDSASPGNTEFAPTVAKKLNLSPVQTEYVDAMAMGLTVEDIFLGNLRENKWTDFCALWELIQKLFQAKMILEPLQADFELESVDATEVKDKHKLSQMSQFVNSGAAKLSYEQFVGFPFFRSLPAQIQDLLYRSIHFHDVPASCQVIRFGDHDRRIFGLIKGQCGIYAHLDEKRRIRKHVLGGPAVFGERGFFLDQPRTADIITLSECQFFTIPFPSELENYIQKEKAQMLSQRLFVVNSLESSPLFKSFSNEIRDRFAFVGNIKPYTDQQLIVKEDTRADSMYFVIQGTVVVQQGTKSIRLLKAGESFGEIALFVSGGKRSASVVSQSDTLLLQVRWQDLIPLISTNLRLAKELQELALRRLHDDSLRNANSRAA